MSRVSGMSTPVASGPSTDEGRYRQAENRLWRSAGVTPTERRIRLASTGTHVRVQEIGEGRPTLFLHGGPNSGSTWATVVGRLEGMRCLVIDRPGTGLSDPWPVKLDEATIPGYADDLVAEILDGLGLDRVDVVASSFGGYVALRSAAAHPQRIGRMVQMACPAFADGMATPAFMRAMTVPGIPRLLGVLPPSERAGRAILRQIGHGVSLDTGRIAPELLDWSMALQRHTDTMPNEGGMIGRVFRFGANRRLTLTAELLGAVTSPTAFLWGADDTFGDERLARRIVSQMPDARLEMMPDAGHLPWLDDPDHAAAFVHHHLAA